MTGKFDSVKQQIQCTYHIDICFRVLSDIIINPTHAFETSHELKGSQSQRGANTYMERSMCESA